MARGGECDVMPRIFGEGLGAATDLNALGLRVRVRVRVKVWG